ncbi:MAG: ABC transporter, permease protein [Candidatus Collierbacteria bacterium GW2011_GWB1_45_35]|uniref:ABC transporter, permease protein n=2 Tax=Candidatus Collieribacteriota TaxID=1752725 RepID=A0A0G1NQ94_9BACT|nr:MAG: ABC transporter, permease protein [Microgenomates group bacterium GW2011_GWC1_44_23]KKT86369.1 MAG: ABC transporter, permease protein [Candidatus Collierbacteria bacterium GW2011_GWA2_44_99]KKT95776.1 MAG: ABC transporter, permease protein [Candidatus Collierbacteria bacterium GW2011_GWA1_45_15]KKU00280.1 MAG: ABC transporter, permease protein [Candidatus Collierbacteria bacterium GW2011_GWB2_45_17]KKU05493.1 MAG: ABC transporter, permease protein [Candidatus Collierbacteria bacterium G
MKFLTGFYQQFTSALADFRRDKVRTALTSLGIMIGVLSVVMLIALGLGLKNYIQQQFENLGANLVMVLPGSGFSGGGPAGLAGGTEFDEKDIRSVEKVDNLKYVVPVYFRSITISSANAEKTGYVMGANEQIFQLMNVKTVAGELWTKADLGKRAKVAVLGFTKAEELYGKAEDALGKTIRIESIRLRVVGIAKKTGDREQDNAAFIPYTTTFGSMNPKKTFWAIYLGIPEEKYVAGVKTDVEKTLTKRYDKDKFSVTEQSEILSTVNQIFGIINLVLIAIGSISLIVGGIGIMNIMYATVTERTREVGIRRAMGATKRDILWQFLTESTLLSLFGGVVGLLLAVVIVTVVRNWFPVAINLFAVILALGVSSGIGIFFGVFPAKKAADLSPMEAIRYE